MHKAAVQGRIGVGSVYSDAAVSLLADVLTILAFAGQVADGAGDSGETMTSLNQMLSQFIVPRAAGLVASHKRLVDEQNVHLSVPAPRRP